MKEQQNIGDVFFEAPRHPSQAHPPPSFCVQVRVAEYERWKGRDMHHSSSTHYGMPSDEAVPLVQVVELMEPFIHRTTSHTGRLERPSKQQLVDTFGTSDSVQVVQAILERGKLAAGKTKVRKGDSKGYLHPM